MDSDDLVIIDSEPSMNGITSPATLLQSQMTKNDLEADAEPDSDTRPLIHTNIGSSKIIGKYRYHNYMRDSNDNCPHCHDFLLEALRETRLGGPPPPPPPPPLSLIPVCVIFVNLNFNLLSFDVASTATTCASYAASAFCKPSSITLLMSEIFSLHDGSCDMLFKPDNPFVRCHRFHLHLHHLHHHLLQ